MMRGNRIIIVPLACAALLLAGCRSESKKKPKPITAKGVAKLIDLPNNRVSMETTSERTGKKLDVEGSVSPDTEVWINGRKSALTDVAPGDQIEAECLRIDDGTNQKFVVSRINVTRPQGWRSTQATPAPAMPVEAGATPPPASPVSSAKPAPVRADETAPANAADLEARREQKTLEIYAEIRKRMDAAIAARAELLAQGTPATDPRIVQHETVIRKARDLLMERGENLDPVVPPLPEDAPATPAAPAPTTQPAGQ